MDCATKGGIKMKKCFIIEYQEWEAYNAETEEEAINMFIKDGHKDDDIISIKT